MKILFALLLVSAAVGFAQNQDRSVPVDNERVRVVKVTAPADNSTGFHVHETNRVMIYFQPGAQLTIRENGPTTTQRWKPSEALWSPAIGRHRVEAIDTPGPVTIAEIELRQPGPANPAALTNSHPLKADPQHFTLDYENEQVRVLRLKVGPSEAIPAHEYLGAQVYTFLTPVDVSTPSGANLAHTAGDVVWSETTAHDGYQNRLGASFEAVIVELK